MADQTEKETKPSAFGPTDQIESFLVGLIAFIQHFLRTLRDLAFSQTQFSLAIKNQNADTKYTKPVTFITLISFLAIRIFRFGVLTLLLTLGTVSCHAETWTENAYPSLLDELQIPSVTEIILYGIPTLIIILLVSQLLKFVLLKGRDESGRTLLSITYYSVGFQYMAYLLLSIILSLIVYFKTSDYFYYLFLIGPVVVILWVVVAYYRLVLKTIDEAHLRARRRGLKQVWLFLWSFLLMVATTLSGAGMAYSLASMEVEQRLAKPVLSMGLIDFDKPGNGRVLVDVLVQNNSKKDVSFRLEEVTVYGKLTHHGEVTNSCQGHPPVITLKPNEVCWLTISFESAGLETHYVFLSKENIVEFNSVNPSGEAGTLSVYIHLGKEIYKISKLE